MKYLITKDEAGGGGGGGWWWWVTEQVRGDGEGWVERIVAWSRNVSHKIFIDAPHF